MPFSFSRIPSLVVAIVLALALGGCANDESAGLDLIDQEEYESTETTSVSVFYPSADTIIQDSRQMAFTADLPLKLMRILFDAEPEAKDIAVSLPEAEVNSVTIEDGTAWVDFSSDVLVTDAPERTQRTALVAIIYTLTQFPDVERVAFTVEGKTAGNLAGKDIETFWGDVTLEQMPWTADAVVHGKEGAE